MLTNWVGDQGFLHKLNISVRQPNMVGDTLWWRGKITAKEVRDGNCMVDLDLEASNQVGRQSALGTATVALPSRARGAVQLPIKP